MKRMSSKVNGITWRLSLLRKIFSSFEEYKNVGSGFYSIPHFLYSTPITSTDFGKMRLSM